MIGNLCYMVHTYVCDLETLKSWGILRAGHSEFGWIVAAVARKGSTEYTTVVEMCFNAEREAG